MLFCVLKRGTMIYFDNAATTKMKPQAVIDAVVQAMTEFGGVGRGVHSASLAAGMTVFEARDAIAQLFNAPSASRVSFGLNVTEALNIAIEGLVKPEMHVITTAASHNSVLRPLYRKVEQGARLSIVPIRQDASLDFDAYEAAFEEQTTLVVATHASNLTGDVYDVARMASIAHAHGALFVLDAAQTAGVIPIDMQAQGIDIVCFTGHKSLYGPQGTGGLVLAEGIELPPLKVGGSGTHSFDKVHPSAMPEGLEAGTLNAHGIAGLAAGVRFVSETGLDAIKQHEDELRIRFEEGLRAIPRARMLGGGGIDRTAAVAFLFEGVDPAVLSDRLQCDYGICTRAGAHCAPLMHCAMGTEDCGAVRASFGFFNTLDEVDECIRALRILAEEL